MQEQMLQKNISLLHFSLLKSPLGKLDAPAVGAQKNQVGISLQSESAWAPLAIQSVCEISCEYLLNQVDVRTSFAQPIIFSPGRFDRADILS